MRHWSSVVVTLITLMLIPVSFAQTSPTISVPTFIRYEGTLHDARAAAAAPGTIGVTFAIYKQQEGGAPVWMETQNVTPDASGKYSALLGSTTTTGLPDDLFSAHEQRWLGIQVQGEAEQPRVMLVSVPYAFKAHEAETLGGKPASAFALAPQSGVSGVSNETSSPSNAPAGGGPGGPKPLISGHGAAGYIAYWKNPVLLGDSLIYQSASGNIGVGSQNPQYPLDVFANNGSAVIVGQQGSNAGVAVEGDALGANGGNVGVLGTSLGETGTGVQGVSKSNAGKGIGVSGESTSTRGIGVQGIALATSGTGFGVYGLNQATSGDAIGISGSTDSASGIAMLGSGLSESGEGTKVTLRPVGVWGDTGESSGVGVLATADFGIAFAGYNNAENISTAKFQNDENTDETGNILATKGGHFGGICEIDVSGDLGCTGNVSGGLLVDGGTRRVAMYAVEAPENWFEDIGSARLSNGSTVVQLESTFAQTINSETEYHVFLTPKGDCKGLYVANETADSFEVRELGGGKARIAFDYRIVARRKGYENVRLADKTKQFDRVLNEPRPIPGKVAAPKIP
jgi:trimeric autotransporter adhesin